MLRLLEEMAGTVYGEHCNEHVLKSLVGELHDSLDDKYDGDDCGDDDDDLEDGDHFSMQGSVGEPPGQRDPVEEARKVQEKNRLHKYDDFCKSMMIFALV